MEKVKPGVWKILLVAAVILIAALYVRSKLSVNTQENSARGAGFNSLFPGLSTRAEAIERLGDPLNAKDSPSLLFGSSNPNLPHEVVTRDDKIVFIKESVTEKDGKTSKDIVELYGEPPNTLYGPDSIHGFNLYIYPDKGIAYLGHYKEPILLEVWYFQPTSLENFKALWAPGYRETPQPRQ